MTEESNRGCDHALLQDDMLLIIFGFLDFPTLIRIQRVCIDWEIKVHKVIPGRLGNTRFQNREELLKGIEKYCKDKVKYADELSSTYGWRLENGKSLESIIFLVHLKDKGTLMKVLVIGTCPTPSIFTQARAFNQDLTNWNTSKAKFMSGMFVDASSFNGDISQWDTSEVVSMWCMFCNATSFNQNIT
eukprot:CAMPEP_0178928764 /NCGR_PEP_ID=MMETSP0786-20121207/20124_1 /TAXON_ID=186022 /ORGANISM="Thalassionema frauenfeldii, Strain CCMP 1798" /LENGTH=187 /DNA_ID=CAMNT_0020604743 /DNA_START=23 /DNA_END=583 /DNA_ORIENTATION=+